MMADDPLAASLEQAAADPAQKPAFARTLFASTVFVLGRIEGETPGRPTRMALTEGTNVILQSQRGPDGATTVPFFSSLAKLQAFANAEVNFLALPAITLFKLAKGSTLVLNPGSSVNGSISAEDLARLEVLGGGP